MGKCSGCGRRRRTIIACGMPVCRDCFVIDVSDKRIPATRINWQARAQAAEATIAAVRRFVEGHLEFCDGRPTTAHNMAQVITTRRLCRDVLGMLPPLAPAASANAARGEAENDAPKGGGSE